MSVQSSKSRSSPADASSGTVPEFDAPDFEEELSRRLWDNYIDRIESALTPLRPAVRREIVQELKTHLLDSIHHDDVEREPERVLNATEKLGRPEEYLEPIVTDRIIEEGATTYHPLWVAKGLGRVLARGLKNGFLGLVFGIGYLVALLITSLAFIKPFYPEHVGLFYDPTVGIEKFAFGVLDQTEGMTEVLGYWMIPVSLILGLLLYAGLTKMLTLLRQPE